MTKEARKINQELYNDLEMLCVYAARVRCSKNALPSHLQKNLNIISDNVGGLLCNFHNFLVEVARLRGESTGIFTINNNEVK